MAYIYNDQSAGDRALSSKINALSVATGRITDEGLFPEALAHDVVFKYDGLYYSRDVLTGAMSTGNADASTIIQNAINGLTAARTWQETIILKGDLGYVHDVILDNYTQIVGSDALITLEDGESKVFKIPETGVNMNDINIKNIKFVAENATNSTGLFLYYGSGGSHYYVDRANVSECKFDNFFVALEEYSTSSIYDANQFTRCTRGLWGVAGDRCITNSKFVDIPLEGTGIYLLDCAQSSITNNLIHSSNADYKGIGIKLSSSHNTTISANDFVVLGRAGIDLERSTYISISGNSFHYAGAGWFPNAVVSLGAFWLAADTACTHIIIDNNIVDHGIILQVGDGVHDLAHEVKVAGNRASAGAGPAFKLYGSLYTVYMWDNIFSDHISPIMGTGTIYVRGNVGYGNIVDGYQETAKIHSSDLFDAAALTDSANIFLQPADSVLDSVRIVLDTRFVAAGLTDLDITVGDAGDPDGILVQAMNLTSDAVDTEYKDRGAYWNAVSGLYKSSATQWIAYATAVGANLNTTSAGQVTFYFDWHSV